MPSTHTSFHYHAIFSTKNRERWLAAADLPKVHAYLGGIVRGVEGVAHAVGGVSDHVHMLLGLRPTHTFSNVMREVKAESSKWIKNNFGWKGFGWQECYGAFTLGAQDLKRARAYVLGQEVHHRKKSFQEESIEMLERGSVEYDERYLW